jgi:hypothetical protein
VPPVLIVIGSHDPGAVGGDAEVGGAATGEVVVDGAMVAEIVELVVEAAWPLPLSWQTSCLLPR